VEAPPIEPEIDVEIVDPDMGVTQTLSLRPEMLLADVKKQYGQKMRRYIQPNSTLSHDGHIVDENKTLAQLGATAEEVFQLVYTSAPFEIIVREKDADQKSGQRLRVYDWYKVHRVKELYSKEATHVEGLVEGDKLIYHGVELDDTKELFRYELKADAVLTVQREDISAIVTRYMCADCAVEVRLKKDDAVRCRSCTSRVLLKIRPPKPVQWQAR